MVKCVYMSGELLHKLRSWRDQQADQRGTEKYRILQNQSLEEIAKSKPESKSELLDIYGIAEKKYQRYGRELLDLVADTDNKPAEKEGEPVSVSAYLQQVNDTLSSLNARVSGEVVEHSIRSTYLFFTIKDSQNEASLQCFMWRRDYEVSDVEIEDGKEVAVAGMPEVYKPNGRFTFRAQTLELVGAGALKQAYEKLKTELEDDGLFADNRKQDLPSFPQTVGLITSPESDAYHDFLANLGSFGFSVRFFASRVQGAKAVKDLLSALDYFARATAIDALVVTRGGGGNLEVLQAFNNETVVRKLADLDVPVIVGIGHEQDQPLTAMAADKAVSTPTACAEILNASWKQLAQRLQLRQQQLIAGFQKLLDSNRQLRDRLVRQLQSHLETTLMSFRDAINSLKQGVQTLAHRFTEARRRVDRLEGDLIRHYEDDLSTVKARLQTIEDQIKRVNPQRRLDQGYSIVTQGGDVVRSVADVSTDANISITVADGTIISDVNSTQSNND